MLRDIVYNTVVKLLCVYVFILAFKRGLFVIEEYRSIKASLVNDEYYCHDVCNKQDASGRFGPRLKECADACRFASRSPLVESVHAALRQTYLCGDVTCTDLMHSVLSSWTTALFFLVGICAIPVFGQRAVNGAWNWLEVRNFERRHNRQCASDGGCFVVNLDNDKSQLLKVD